MWGLKVDKIWTEKQTEGQQDMYLWNMDAPGGNKVKTANIFKSYILTPPHPQGQVMSGKREQPYSVVV